MSTMSQFFGGGTTIRSIQRGVILMNGTTTATATISAVTTSKTELRLLGFRPQSTNQIDATLGILQLTNSTTITATRDTTSGSTNISWELTEWN